jgi:predicted dehydrogenase
VDARLFARKASPDPRDVAAALVEFESGATGQLATVRAGPMFWRIHVFGTKGWAEARGETALTVALMGEEPETRTYPAVDSLGVLIESFVDAIETGTPFLVSTAQMLDTVGGFEAVIASIESKRPVSVMC